MSNDQWLIISWAHDDLMNGAYGKVLSFVDGTEYDATLAAREFIAEHAPVGIVRVVQL